MKKAVISVSLRGKSFSTSFVMENENTPEYIIADEAYNLAMMFAKTRMIAEYGHILPHYKISDFLKDLDYDYTIEEVQE